MDDVLRKLERTDPALARQLRGLNWSTIRKEVAKRAIARAAAKINNCRIKDSHDNSTSYQTASGAPPNGTCVGVLQSGDVQLGVALDGTTLLLFWNGYAMERGSHKLEQMTKVLEDAYRIEAYKAMLQLIGGTPTEQTTSNGLVILSTNLREEV
ncbi:TPA: hypothetical protein DEP34_00565 [Candidatus Uhrbacteria bacterium]|nr:hypothetical protein [Candidatus Uhrbacteria bacterium]